MLFLFSLKGFRDYRPHTLSFVSSMLKLLLPLTMKRDPSYLQDRLKERFSC